MKTLYQFLEQGEPTQADPKVKQAEKKENMLKKRVLAAKMRAVRGGATGIMASHEPDGELVEGVMKMIKSVARKKKEKTAEKAMDAGARAKRKLARKVHAKYVSGSEDNVPDDIRESDVHSGQGEKIQKRTKKWMDKKGMKGAPGLDAMKARTAEHKAKRGVKEEIVTEADPRLAIYQSGMTDASRVKGPVGKAVDKVKDKVKKVLGKKDKVSSHLDRYRFQSGLDNYLKSKVKKEDKAYDYVVSQLKKKYGDGVLTKGDKIKPPTAAQKKAAAAHRAKVDKENAAERAKDPSQGRYPPGYSNRGSD